MAVKTRYVYDIKHDSEGNMTRYDARLVAQGFNQVPGRHFDETWAPVLSSATTRALFAVAAARDWEVHNVDVKTAFLNAKMDKEMYITLPVGAEPGEEDDVRRLNLALYGTTQAGRLWGIKLNKDLNAIGAVRSKVDPCLYTWSHPVHGLVYILVYIYDLIVAGKSLEGVQMVKASVSASFDVRDMGEVKDFIGMKVMRDRAAKVITLSHPGHVSSLLEAFQMEKSAPNKMPMVSGAKRFKTGENLLPEGNRYADLVGSLLYLSTTTRPDIAFAVGVLSRYMAGLEEDHMRAAKGVLRYLRGATRLGVVYGDEKPVQGYVDADWAGDIDARRSTTGFVFTLNGGPISWTSKRQPTVATSMAEAEYVAAAMATKEAMWLRKILSGLGVDGDAVPMGEDNQACLALVNNPEATGRTKHVDVAYHMVRDYVARGEVAFYFFSQRRHPGRWHDKATAGPGVHHFPGRHRRWLGSGHFGE